jgi:hypothetical protein
MPLPVLLGDRFLHFIISLSGMERGRPSFATREMRVSWFRVA